MKQYLATIMLFLFGYFAILQQTRAQSNTPAAVTKVPAVSGGLVYTPSAYNQNIVLHKVLTVQPQRPYTSLTDVMSDARTVEEVRKSVLYSDDLGRPLQTIDWQVTPGKKDMVSPQVYDGFGRETFQFLPYASAASDANFRTNPFNEQYSFYTGTYTSQQPAFSNEQLFYSKAIYEPSPLNRVTASYAPGNSWAGSEGSAKERAVKMSYLVNDAADNVKNWTIAYSAHTYSGDDAATNIPAVLRDYTAGELMKTVSVDEKGFQVIDYTDLNGRTILHKVQTDISNTNVYIGWLCTYYVYDDFGRLRVTITPTLVEKMAQANNWSITSTQLNGLCYRYEYDQRGRQWANKSPGKAWVYIVYDKKDRQVFVQDGNLAAQTVPQWNGTLYDELNRPIQTGVLYYSGNRSQLQALVDAQGTSTNSISIGVNSQDSIATNLVINQRQTGRTSYKATGTIIFESDFNNESTAEFTAEIVNPTSTTYAGNQLVNASPIPPGLTFVPLSYNFYDGYSFTAKTFTSSYNTQLDAGTNTYADPVPAQATSLVNGKLTGTRVKIIENPADLSKGGWLENVHFYDATGRSLQTQHDNYKGGVDIVTSRFGFSGAIISSYQVHSNTSAHIKNMTVKTNWNYDHVGRLLDIRKNVNSAPERIIARYVYDAMGQLLTKKIGQKRLDANTLSADALEEQQYSYNIRGWLKGINWDYTSDVSKTKPQTNKWFAMDLSYDWGFDSSQYNGSITGQRWQNGGDKAERAFGYDYDGAGRFMKADFRQYFGSNWHTTDGSGFTIDYSVKMGTDGLNTGSAYDANGNILKMQQWGLKLNQSPQVDNLTYHYATDNNLLKNVVDGMNDTQTLLGDFKTSSLHPDANNTSSSRNDYVFDRNGNIIKDLNKDLGNAANNGVEYNPYTGLPYRIKKYNPAVSGGIGSDIEYVYDAAGVIHEKRLIKATLDGGVTKQSTIITTYLGGFVYENNVLQFFGHEEGRVRFAPILGAVTPEIRFDYFIRDHLSNTRSVLTDEWKQDIYQAGMEDAMRATEVQLFAKIPEAEVNKPGGFDSDNANQKVSVVNANNANSRIGPNIVLKVMAGDRVRIRTQAWYQPAGNIAPDNNLGSIVSNLLGTLSTGVQGASLGKANASQLTGNNLLAPPIDPLINNRSYDNTRPKAYLNWILLDEQQYKSVSGNCGFTQVPQISGSDAKQVVQANGGEDIGIQKNGYLFVFVSNESYANVYFDDLRVEHLRGALQEENQYYPYGLKMTGISSKAALSIQNNFQYQAAFSEHDEETGYNEFALRHYDAQVGRWTGVDPYQQFASPYTGMGNNPVNGVDPDGGFFDFFKNKQGEVLWDKNSTAASIFENGQEWFNIGKSYTVFDEALGTMYTTYESDGKLFGNPFFNQSGFTPAGDDFYIRVYEKSNSSFGTNWKNNKNWFSQLTYSIADQFYIASQLFRKNASDFTHIGGGRVTTKEATLAFAGTATSFIPAGASASGGSKLAGAEVKIASEVIEEVTEVAAKTGGRLGNAATRSQIDNIATTLESRGYTITGGGGRTAEEFLKPLGGGRKGGSYLDITATHPNYPTLRINTVDVYKNGLPTLRELNNAARIRTQIAPGEHLLLIPKR